MKLLLVEDNTAMQTTLQRGFERRGEPVRMAVLLQPVGGEGGQGVVVIRVAALLELRHSLARRLLTQTLWQQALLLAVTALVVVLVMQLATRPVRVRSHEWALRALTRNLLRNAARHTPAAGRLVVRPVADTHQAVLTVADSGPGLAPAVRDRLFQPFSAGGTRAGSGLGLAICQEIVQSLGGQIALVNRQAGARITDAIVRLPQERT